VARGLADTFLHFDSTGVLRAGAIVAGLATTTLGYLVGSISSQIVDSRSVDQTSMSQHRTVEAPLGQ
jgi:hypothetical protein